MNRLNSEQLAAIKKMSTGRLAARLIRSGEDEEQVFAMDRTQLSEAWARVVLEGRDVSPHITPLEGQEGRALRIEQEFQMKRLDSK